MARREFADHERLRDARVRPCRWFHRWDDGTWIGGIADPVFRFVCRRCGATQTRRVAP